MPALVSFRVLLEGLGPVLADTSFQSQDTVLEVEVTPPDGAHLAASRTGRHGEPNKRAPVR
ncbi:MAG TPA: hypothetical protein VHX59_12520, partial [Mycobacteriales bacterium]|nr:hypothetical protein [Mycobacteriales bacterium]